MRNRIRPLSGLSYILAKGINEGGEHAAHPLCFVSFECSEAQQVFRFWTV